MTDKLQITLASISDASLIARMSRDYIEHGLGWRWQEKDIVQKILDAETNVVVARMKQELSGFAMMDYAGFEAHLALFAVLPKYQRLGIGTALVRWLITTAQVAGAHVVYVEMRRNNQKAKAFYQSLGFQPMEPLPNYYSGREAGLRMAYDLRAPASTGF